MRYADSEMSSILSLYVDNITACESAVKGSIETSIEKSIGGVALSQNQRSPPQRNLGSVIKLIELLLPRLYVCTICDTHFATRDSCECHMVSSHRDMISCRCWLCNRFIDLKVHKTSRGMAVFEKEHEFHDRDDQLCAADALRVSIGNIRSVIRPVPRRVSRSHARRALLRLAAQPVTCD